MISDKQIARVQAIVNTMVGEDDLAVIPSAEPESPELSGGLTPERHPDYNAYQDYLRNRPHKLWKD